MRKRFLTLATAVGLIMALSIPVGAADLPGRFLGTFDCAGGTVTLHFVNNQTGGAAAGEITVMTSNPTANIGPLAPSQVNKNVQHFIVVINGGATLDSATTNLGGRLVLSDFECTPGKKKK